MSVLVIDIGTSGLRAAVVRHDGSLHFLNYEACRPNTPAPGMVEFDAQQMADSVLRVCLKTIEQARASDKIVSVGITNQRASTVIWSKSTGKPFGPDFPIISVRDWVNSQARLADRLGIQQWAAVIGGSLGGMQVMRWAISYPDRLRHALVIAAAPKLSAQNIAFNEVARQSIMSDPDFHKGRYYDFNTYPRKGVMLARMVGHITYLSDALMREKFGKDATAGNFGRDMRNGKLSYGIDESDFEVQSYLQYKGEAFSKNFDANTYLLITKTLDYFDPAVDYDGDLSLAFAGNASANSNCKFLVMSFSSDWRFAPERSRDLVEILLKAKRDVIYLEIEADEGHDAFLLPIPRYMAALRAYLGRVAIECNAAPKTGGKS